MTNRSKKLKREGERIAIKHPQSVTDAPDSYDPSDEPTFHTVSALEHSWLQAKSQLPGGVTQPTGSPTSATGSMTGKKLHTKIKTYSGQEWKGSAEYAEICYRLITWTAQELYDDDLKVPQWKVNP